MATLRDMAMRIRIYACNDSTTSVSASRRGLTLLGIGGVALLAAGGSFGRPLPQPPQSRPSSVGEVKHLKLAFVTNNASDFWSIVRKGVEKAEKEDGDVEVDFRMPSTGEAAKQRSIVEDELTAGVQGIAISPVDPENQTEMLNAAASRCLLITHDSDAPKSNRACYVGTDNHAAGVKMGGEIRKALPQGGRIALFVGSFSAQNARDRIGGIEEALKGSHVTIVAKRADEVDHEKAQQNAAEILARRPHVAALVGIWSYNGPAILRAVSEVGKKRKTKILCFDDAPDTLRGLESGAISAALVQQPFQVGYDSVRKMAAYLRGDRSVFPANRKAIVDAIVLTPANVRQFETNFAKLKGG